MSDAKTLLERALAAEERADELQRRIEDLEGRFKAALNADPTTASRALSWVGRAEEAERLLRGLMLYVEQRSIATREFPPGWVEQARSQLRSVDILERDLNRLVERPEDTEYWTRWDEPDGRRSIIRDS